MKSFAVRKPQLDKPADGLLGGDGSSFCDAAHRSTRLQVGFVRLLEGCKYDCAPSNSDQVFGTHKGQEEA